MQQQIMGNVATELNIACWSSHLAGA